TAHRLAARRGDPGARPRHPAREPARAARRAQRRASPRAAPRRRAARPRERAAPLAPDARPSRPHPRHRRSAGRARPRLVRGPRPRALGAHRVASRLARPVCARDDRRMEPGRRSRRALLSPSALASLALLAWAFPGAPASGAGARAAQAPPPDATPVGAEWPMYNKDYHGQRWSELKAVTPETVAYLAEACRIQIMPTASFQPRPPPADPPIY